MLTICDTHVLIFWQDDPQRLPTKAKQHIKMCLKNKTLACADITLWEITMLIKHGRLRNDISAQQYIEDIILTMSLTVLPITPQISALSQENMFIHKDPADRLIASTAMEHQSPLISADSKLQKIKALTIIWS